MLVGLNGNDKLSGGSGNDILIGGRGQDTLNGDQGEDLLVAGFTGSDGIEDNSVFLKMVKEKWSDARPFKTRVAAFSSVLVPRTTLINDSSIDTLISTGDQSSDWLFAALADDVLRDAGDFLQAL